MRTRLLLPSAVILLLASAHCSSGGSGGKAPGDTGGDGGASSGGGSGGSGSGGGSGGSSSGGGSGGGSGSSTGSGGSSGGGSGSSGGSGGGSSGGAGAVTFSIDLSKGPARQFQPPAKPTAISPYVYGVNAFAAWNTTTKWGMLRWGGDAMTDWNWTNNQGNSASDYCFWQGNEGGGATLAGTVTAATPSVPSAQTLGAASLVTVPIVDYVSSSAVTNNVWSGSTPPCPGTPSCSGGGGNGTAMNVGNLVFASTTPTSTAFVANNPTKSTALCTSTTGNCAVSTTGAVYQDEFVNYMKVTYGAGAGPVFFMLDNEPNYWPSTHPEIWAHTGTPGCGTTGTVSFDDIVTRNTTYATAVKKAWPTTKTFGPVVAQDGIIYAGDYSDPNLPTTFSDYYLGKMAAASATAKESLLDAFDVHYYTSNGSTAQCVQVPRMFWDPTFEDFTAAQTDSIDFGWSGQNNYFDTDLYPRQMIPRLQGKIATAYTGNATAAPGLSFSEYNAGCETSIEGGVAEADLLGIFGREGVYAATSWPLQTVTSNGALVNYLVAAYDAYRSYDGKGGSVGDTTVNATTSDVEDTSVYAFAHSTDATAVDVVGINKTSAAVTVTVNIASAPALTTAALYQLVTGKAGVVAVGGTAPTPSCTGTTCTLDYTLPAMSVTTIVLR